METISARLACAPLKGNECKAPDKCELIRVTGLDGEHEVHACVPVAKRQSRPRSAFG